MRKKFIVWTILCFIVSGCSSYNIDWNPFYKPADIAQPVVPQTQQATNVSESNPFVDSGRIIKKESLSKGGTLLIIPFRAGPGVEANERLDELSLKMVQGVSDQLKDFRPYFKIITDEGKETADVVLKGFFMELSGTGRLKDFLPGVSNKKIEVEGQMVPRGSNQPILVFTDSIEVEDKSKDYLTMSYELGADIGKFIRSGVAK